MASLRDTVSAYQDDLRNGTAWLAFWTQRSTVALHGWRSGVRAGAGRRRRFTLIWTTLFIQRTGRGLQRYRLPIHGPLWVNGYYSRLSGRGK